MTSLYSTLLVPGEPNMPEKIIMALKLSRTVKCHDTSTDDRRRREGPNTAWDSHVGPDHEIYRKSSHFCGHQEVCEEYISDFRYTPPGKMPSFRCMYRC